MSQKDIYIARIDEVLDDYDDRAAGDLVKEVVAVFANEDEHIKTGLDRYRGRVSAPGVSISYDNQGDLKKLRGKLMSLREAERKELEADPARLPLLPVEDDIAECERLLDSGKDDESHRFVDRMVQVYGSEIENIAVGLSGYGYGPEGASANDDLSYILDHLKHYHSKLALELVKSSSCAVNVNANAVNQNTVDVAVTVVQVAEQIQSLPAGTLSDGQKMEIKALLLELEAVKGKPKKEAEKPLKKVFSWLADKGVDVGIALLPYLAQAVVGL